jgi:outer membrane lipoprotein SlyB
MKPVMFKAMIAGVAVVASAVPGLAGAQSGYYEYRSAPIYSNTPERTYSYSYSESGPDYPPNRDGYGTTSNPYYAQPGDPGYADYRDRDDRGARFHGTVEAVEIVSEGGRASGGGAVVGALAGGALGNQVGHGSGNTAATIGGVIGGAYLGNELERRHNRNATQRIRVRMDDGSIQIFAQDAPQIRVGDRVRVERGGHLELA